MNSLACLGTGRIASSSLISSPEAAAFVDRHVAPVAHRIRPTQLDRLVEEAVAAGVGTLAIPLVVALRQRADDEQDILHVQFAGHGIDWIDAVQSRPSRTMWTICARGNASGAIVDAVRPRRRPRGA